MKSIDRKLNVIFIGIFLTTSEFFVCVNSINGCALKYEKHVDDKPNFFLITSNVPGICHIQQEDNSTQNYHSDRKYAEEIRPETVIGGLNYDAQNGTILYWAKIANVDHARLYKVRLNDSFWEPVLHQDDDFRDMTYDWVSKNLYIIMGIRSIIVAVNAERPWNPTVVIYDRSQMTSLAVHPNKGYLFFIETSYWYGVQTKIHRAHLDGSNVIAFNRTGNEARYYIGSVVVDFYADRLYWSMPGADKIQHSNLDGQDVRTISGVRVYSGQQDLSSRALAVDKHYVYYRSLDVNSVKRVEKSSEAKDADFELYNRDNAPVTEILAFTYTTQKVRKDHPCKENRGGCEKYCFAVPFDNSLKRVCKCSFNDVVAADGVSCVRRRQPIGR